MSTKKNFVEIMTFLTENKDKKVSSIMDELTKLVETKKSTSNILYDENKKVIAIFCYYHKQWELIAEVNYGVKRSSASGWNTMCKIGTNAWTKQQSLAKKAKNDLLDLVAKGEVDPKDLKARLDEIETNRLVINKTNMPKGTKDIPNLKTK